MVLQSYRRLFALPHVSSLLLWSLASRLYMPGQPIAITFLVAEWTGSYTKAGLILGLLIVGTALVAPIRGRMADRGAADRIVLVCGIVYALGLTLIAVLPARLWWAAVPIALASGLFTPPANQIVRAMWPRLTTGRDLRAVYAAEATTQELLFVFGPMLAAGAVAMANARVALLLLAATALTGSLGFMVALRRAGVVEAVAGSGDETSPAPGPRLSLLCSGWMALFLPMMLLVVVGLIGVDLVMVAWANERSSPGLAMVLAGVWAAGSLVGGLVAGALPGTPHLSRRFFGAAVGVVLLVPFLPPLTHLPTPLLILPVLFVSGLAIAPTLAAVMGRLSDIAPPNRRAEAFGWMTTAQTTGAASAAPVMGALMDWSGVAAGAAGAAVAVVLAAVISPFIPAPHGERGERDGAAAAGRGTSGHEGEVAGEPDVR
ncbi:MFS transporter [Nocardiopsis rhodophaea]|uniref:MFS transporter n=1 Tax=Nocardiopsis rhodophaea TaxID=280238 RepID=A0ABP5E7C5_9ACTN